MSLTSRASATEIEELPSCETGLLLFMYMSEILSLNFGHGRAHCLPLSCYMSMESLGGMILTE
jgi:hypothetical protein